MLPAKALIPSDEILCSDMRRKYARQRRCRLKAWVLFCVVKKSGRYEDRSTVSVFATTQ